MPIICEAAVTNAQIATLRFASRALVTSGNGVGRAAAAGFRLRLGGGVALRLRSRRLSVSAPLFPLADRRPKPNQRNLPSTEEFL